jgi:hypothetical protein
MTAFAVKSVPPTFMVTELEPAAIACGNTERLLGAPNDPTTVVPQPSGEKQAVIPRITPIALTIFKAHL